MTDQQPLNRLHRHMIATVALEAEIEQALTQLLAQPSEHPQVQALVQEFHELVRSQRQALETRLRTVASNVPDFGSTFAPSSDPGQESDYPASTALRHLYTLFSRALMAYTILQPLTLRFRDSWVTGEENTAIIARQHTISYAAALQKISQLIHDIVLWEMNQEGLECRCTCPSCSLGVCLCAAASRALLAHAWTEAGPIVVDKGITVLPPKSASAALNAGLRGGDLIIAVDGHEVDTYHDIQDKVRAHQSGETIALQVRRDSGELVDIAVEIP